MNTLSKEKFLLLKLMEECSEVSQRASKAIQFGFDEVEPCQDKDNHRRLQDEIHDLLSVIVLLGEVTAKPFEQPWSATVRKKENKILKYLNYSEELGELKVE